MRILDETVLQQEAKMVLVALGVEGMTMLYLAKKMAKDIDELLTKTAEAIQADCDGLKLARWALESANVAEAEVDAIISRGARQIAALAIGMIDKVAAGEAVDEHHAAFLTRIGQPAKRVPSTAN